MSNEQVVDGIVIPDDENVIVVPNGYLDPVITKEHFRQQGENVMTCNMLLQDPLKKIGTEVSCPVCGRKFKVVLQNDVVTK